MRVFVHHRRVEFHETDAAGLVHFSNYLRYAEAAEHALFRELDYPMLRDDGHGRFYGWPRVRAQAKFSAPLQSGDAIRIELAVAEIKLKAIEFSFRIYCDPTGELAAKGSFTTMHTFRDPSSRTMKSVPIPGILIELLKPYCRVAP